MRRFTWPLVVACLAAALLPPLAMMLAARAADARQDVCVCTERP